jgi:FAD/FMN-containing dehydrogenase
VIGYLITIAWKGGPSYLSLALAFFVFRFFARRRDKRKAQRRLLAAPGLVVDREKRAVQFLKHIRDALIALVAAANVRLSHLVRAVLPGITARGQNHQRKQTRSSQAKRLAFDELDLDDAAGLGELVTALCLQGGDAFTTRSGALGALQARVKAAFDPLGVLNPGRMEGRG